MGVNTDQSTGHYPVDQSLSIPLGETVPGHTQDDDFDSDPVTSQEIPLTPGQDEALGKWMKNNSHNNYNLYNNSCVDFVRNGLKAVGVKMNSATLNANTPSGFIYGLTHPGTCGRAPCPR